MMERKSNSHDRTQGVVAAFGGLSGGLPVSVPGESARIVEERNCADGTRTSSFRRIGLRPDQSALVPYADTMRASCQSIKLENYRSFETATLRPDRLTAIVGANSAGKSNLIDAFRFVSEALAPGVGLAVALERRGGFERVVHQTTQSGGRRRNIRLTLELRLGGDFNIQWYSVYLEAKKGGYQVKEEVLARDERLTDPIFAVRGGGVTVAPAGLAPPWAPERLTLPLLASHPDIAPAYDFLEACKRAPSQPIAFVTTKILILGTDLIWTAATRHTS